MLFNQKSAEHLIHLIVTRNSDTPNFALLLGSGASVTSGVRTAQDMIDEWRRLLFNRSQNGLRYNAWLDSQDWYNHEDEYSILFEKIYDQPAQRRVYIEECVKDGQPSWGYVYLTNLLKERYFDVAFTTNFDDLLNEACYLYSDGLRPIVAAHDSAIQGIRVSSSRPKIIKLHGDFLYDNIKNTLAELETLETNTKRKLAQFAQEYGLVVLGYSGRDRSIMDTLELLLRDEDNYKQGIYWCTRHGAERPARLESLLRKDRVYLVEVNGFDEFTADLHNSANLSLPKSIAQPFEMARDRVRLFTDIQDPLRSHSVISGHVEEVLRAVRRSTPTIPPEIEAVILSSLGESDEAISKWKEAYENDKESVVIAYAYADALAGANKYDELAAFVTQSPLPPGNKTYFLLKAGQNQQVIEYAEKALTNPATVKGTRSSGIELVRINRAIAFKRLGRTSEMWDDLHFLERHGYSRVAAIKAGIAALKGEKEKMISAIKEALPTSITKKDLKAFPVFEDYQNDPDFLKLSDANDEDKGIRRLDANQ